MKSAGLAAALTASLALGGCFGGPNEAGGTLGGAAIGGIIGNQFGGGAGRVAATIAGAAIGGAIGGSIGRDLDERERQMAYEAQYYAVAEGRPRRWEGRPGYYGYIEPGTAYEGPDGYCRPYTHSVWIDGRPSRVNGLACREAGGGWRIVS